MLASYQTKLYGLLSAKTGTHVVTLNDALMKLQSPVDKRLKAKLRKMDMLGKMVRHLTPTLLDSMLNEVDACIIPNMVDDAGPPAKVTASSEAKIDDEDDPKQLTLTAVFAKQLRESKGQDEKSPSTPPRLRALRPQAL